jgi:sirohydrochlorin cobaltochelatase
MNAVVLVGHGGVPSDYPRDRLSRLRSLEARRRAVGGPVSDEERELDRHVRAWPRTSRTDPYRAGLEALAERLAAKLPDARLQAAYNEFCAPSIDDAVSALVRDGATDIVVVSAMLTPGGSHAEIEIPEELDRLREAHPGASIRYAWPFDLDALAGLIAGRVLEELPR